MKTTIAVTDNIIIAVGNVEIKNKNRRILADKIRYDKIKDIGIATGNVKISGGELLLGNMTTTERDALTAANGMIIYNTTLNKFQGYENGSWANLI